MDTPLFLLLLVIVVVPLAMIPNCWIRRYGHPWWGYLAGLGAILLVGLIAIPWTLFPGRVNNPVGTGWEVLGAIVLGMITLGVAAIYTLVAILFALWLKKEGL